MIIDAIISEQHTIKNQSYITIHATFKPSPYESYKCLLKLSKQIQQKEWKMNDLYISNCYNQYESIMSLYSDELLYQLKDEALNQLVKVQGA
ncbi:MAG: hypothetical protein ACQEWV_29675 [Bacillota bacterium]